MFKKTIVKLSIATFIAISSLNFIYAEPTADSKVRQFVMDYDTPAKFKLSIALKYEPDSDFINVNDAIYLLKQVVANKDSIREEKRIAHYKLAEIYYQIYYSNPNNHYSKYKDIGKSHMDLVIYLSSNRLSFNIFNLYGSLNLMEMPPKIVLNDLEYLAPIKLLYYFFYHGELKHSEFKVDKLKAKKILSELISLNYADAFEYKLSEKITELLDEKYDVSKDTDIFIYPDITTKGILLYRELIGKDLGLDAKYSRLVASMKKINSLFTSKLEERIKKLNYSPDKLILKKWKEKYAEIDWELFVLNDKEKALRAKILEKAVTKESIAKHRAELEIKTKAYLNRRDKTLKETGHDINDDNVYFNMMKKFKKDGRVF